MCGLSWRSDAVTRDDGRDQVQSGVIGTQVVGEASAEVSVTSDHGGGCVEVAAATTGIASVPRVAFVKATASTGDAGFEQGIPGAATVTQVVEILCDLPRLAQW